MVDREARQVLSGLLRRLATGQISNDEFEDLKPRSIADLAIREIDSKGAWLLYDDTREYRLVRRDALRPETRREVARWVLFLTTDREYEWPSIPPTLELALFLVSVVTLGLAGRIARVFLSRGGDDGVWPFRRRTDYEEALKTSRLFRGAA